MRFAHHGRGVCRRRFAFCRCAGEQPGRPQRVQTANGYFRFGCATVGPDGSGNSETRTVSAAANREVEIRLGDYNMPKITPFLWFDKQAEEAVKFYTSVFKNSKVGRTLRYDEASAKPDGGEIGSVLTIEFEIEGQKFTALNGGPQFKFNESVSFVVNCKTQD